jgi:hypothetical protein
MGTGIFPLSKYGKFDQESAWIKPKFQFSKKQTSNFIKHFAWRKEIVVKFIVGRIFLIVLSNIPNVFFYYIICVAVWLHWHRILFLLVKFPYIFFLCKNFSGLIYLYHMSCSEFFYYFWKFFQSKIIWPVQT